MPDRKISELDPTTSVNTGAMFPLSQTEGENLKTIKGTVDQIGDYIANRQDHSTLNTVSKKLIGAINEILASGIGSIEGSASGSVASFNDGGDNIPAKSLVAEIVATQAGSGTPSPSNPRAISGYTDVVIKNDVQETTQATYTISLGSTVYMGTLNVTTGILTVTHAYQVYDGSENWQYSENGSGRQRVYLPIAGAMPDSINIIGNIIEKAAAPTAGYPADWTALFNHNASPSLLIGVPSSITSAQDFKDFIANTNLQVVYELSAPIVIQLTPTEVRTLLGENNIYADSGDVEVTYFTDKANEIAELVETYMGDFESGTVRSYTATLTSSEYGWFTFVDENGNNLFASVGIPIQATAIVSGKYYHGLFSQQADGRWLFKIADINDSGNYKPIGTSLSNIQFNLSYTKL